MLYVALPRDGRKGDLVRSVHCGSCIRKQVSEVGTNRKKEFWYQEYILTEPVDAKKYPHKHAAPHKHSIKKRSKVGKWNWKPVAYWPDLSKKAKASYRKWKKLVRSLAAVNANARMCAKEVTKGKWPDYCAYQTEQWELAYKTCNHQYMVVRKHYFETHDHPAIAEIEEAADNFANLHDREMSKK